MQSPDPKTSVSQVPLICAILGIICGALCFVFTGIVFVVVGVIGFALAAQAVQKKNKLGYVALPIAIAGWIYTLWLTVFVL